MESAKVCKRGTIVVPAKLRKRSVFDEGSFVTAEAREDGILLRPAAIVPIENTRRNAGRIPSFALPQAFRLPPRPPRSPKARPRS